jgi:hypothetical protein
MTQTVFTIDGQRYTAFNEGGSWMVRWFKVNPQSTDDEGNYVEALIAVDTQDPQVAIKAAIARGSWA